MKIGDRVKHEFVFPRRIGTIIGKGVAEHGEVASVRYDQEEQSFAPTLTLKYLHKVDEEGDNVESIW